MATQKRKSAPVRAHTRSSQTEMDGTFFLKLVLYLIIGSFWIKITAGSTHIPIPFGLLVGLLFTRQERFQIDKKIEYAVLLIAMFVGLFAPFGIYINM